MNLPNTPRSQLESRAIEALSSKHVSLHSAIKSFALLNELGVSLEDSGIHFDWVVQHVLFGQSGVLADDDYLEASLTEQIETNLVKWVWDAIQKLERAAHRELSLQRQQQFLLEAARLHTTHIAKELQDEFSIGHSGALNAIGDLASEWLWYEFDELGDSYRRDLQEILGDNFPRQDRVPPPVGTPVEIIASYGRALKALQTKLEAVGHENHSE